MVSGRSSGRSPGRSPARSLKGRALQWLAQREQSRSELRRKLLPHARAEVEAEIAALADVDAVAAAVPAERVDALLDWLEARRYLSAERFVESRVHARASRFGNLRIRQELKQHQVPLPANAAQALRDSELERACAVLDRKFGAPPANSVERLKQMRFLTGRGFTPEVIRQALRRNGAEQHATLDG
jgi:regulatory protein